MKIVRHGMSLITLTLPVSGFAQYCAVGKIEAVGHR